MRLSINPMLDHKVNRSHYLFMGLAPTLATTGRGTRCYMRSELFTDLIIVDG